MFDYIPRPTSPSVFPPQRMNPWLRLGIAVVGLFIVMFFVYALVHSVKEPGCTLGLPS